MKRILLVDGTNVFIRSMKAYNLVNTYGTNIGGLVGTLKSINYAKKQIGNIDDIFVIFDGKDTYKSKLYENQQYKANRRKNNYNSIYNQYKNQVLGNINRNFSINAFKWNMQRILDYFDKLNILYYIVNQREADEAIALFVYFAQRILQTPDFHIFIMSSDKDLFQLISKNVSVYNPVNKEIIDLKKFKKNYKFYPYNYPLYKSIIGDSSDNIKGIKGVGSKTFEKYLLKIIEGMDYIITPEIFFKLFEKEYENKELRIKILKDFVLSENQELIKNNYKFISLSKEPKDLENIDWKIVEDLENIYKKKKEEKIISIQEIKNLSRIDESYRFFGNIEKLVKEITS